MFKYLLLCISLLMAGCSSTMQVQSAYNDKIVVDGIHSDWGQDLKYIEEENIAFGFVNNKDFLYLSLVSSDRITIRKIVMNGLTVWIESTEGRIGIKYPFKPDPSQLMDIRMRQIPPDRNDISTMMKDMLKGREDLQVVNEDELPLYTFRADAGESFRGKINVENDFLVYELQIPLKKNEISARVFGNGVKETEITFMTNKLDREGMRGNAPQRDGMREPGKMGGGRRGGGMSPGGMDFTPMEYTFKVVLK